MEPETVDLMYIMAGLLLGGWLYAAVLAYKDRREARKRGEQRRKFLDEWKLRWPNMGGDE